MKQYIKSMMHKIIGINNLQSSLDHTLKSSDILTLEHFDSILQQRLDERLNFYFRWRLPIQFSEKSQILIHTNDGHRLYVDTKEPFMTIHLLEHGEWETPVRRELRKLLGPKSVFIDIGANIGLHTLFATTLISNAGLVIAVEPHPVTCELLRKNLEINGLLDRVKISRNAISNIASDNVEFEYFVEHPGMSGLSVSRDILKKFNGTIEKTTVQTTTVDLLVEKYGRAPDLIKIDVEGFEYNVLQGCHNTIKNYPSVKFLLEHEKEMAGASIRPGIEKDIAHFFDSNGFKVFKVGEKELLSITFNDFIEDDRGDYVFIR